MKKLTLNHRIFARLAALAAVAALALSAPAFAQFAETESKFYGAVEVGRAMINDWCSAARSLHTRGFSCDDGGIAWGGDVGYRFNEYFAAEAGMRFASGFKTSGGTHRHSSINVSTETDVIHFMFGGRASYPVNDFFVFGKAGLNSWELEANAAGFDAVSSDGNNPYFGAGAGYVFEDAIEVRLSFTRFIYDGGGIEDDADLIAVSGAYRF